MIKILYSLEFWGLQRSMGYSWLNLEPLLLFICTFSGSLLLSCMWISDRIEIMDYKLIYLVVKFRSSLITILLCKSWIYRIFLIMLFGNTYSFFESLFHEFFLFIYLFIYFSIFVQLVSWQNHKSKIRRIADESEAWWSFSHQRKRKYTR